MPQNPDITETLIARRDATSFDSIQGLALRLMMKVLSDKVVHQTVRRVTEPQFAPTPEDLLIFSRLKCKATSGDGFFDICSYVIMWSFTRAAAMGIKPKARCEKLPYGVFSGAKDVY